MRSFILVLLAFVLAGCTSSGTGSSHTSKPTEGIVGSVGQPLHGPDLVSVPFSATVGEVGTGAERVVTFYDGFSLDTTEITEDQYGECYTAGFCSATGTADNCNWAVTGHEDYPVNCVTYIQATQYCAWAGKRLPTAPEWEYAAQYPEDGRLWPWGNDDSSYTTETNSAASGDGYTYTAPVGSYPAGDSALGLKDMSGNVWEITQSPSCTSETGACTNCPEGETCDDACNVCGANTRSMLGGSYGDGVAKVWLTTSTNAFDTTSSEPRVGFRCAKNR